MNVDLLTCYCYVIKTTLEQSASKFCNHPLQQGCRGGAGARSRNNFGWLEPEPKSFRWWNRSLKFGFRFHKDSLWGNLWGKRLIQIIWCFLWFFGPNCSGSGAKRLPKLRRPELEPEPEIWVPVPHPTSLSKAADTNALQSHHFMTPEQWSWLLCSSAISANKLSLQQLNKLIGA